MDDFIYDVGRITNTIGAQLLWCPWSFTVIDTRTGQVAATGAAFTENGARQAAKLKIKKLSRYTPKGWTTHDTGAA